MVFYNENRVSLSKFQCWHMLGDFLEHCKKVHRTVIFKGVSTEQQSNRAAWCSPEPKHRAYTKERKHEPHGRAALVS